MTMEQGKVFTLFLELTRLDRACYNMDKERLSMAQRDIYHNTVVNALKKVGWTITHDPLIIPFGGQNLFVDLGAERLIAAERAGQQIAVEIKSFLSPSGVRDLEDALGQYMLYRSLLQRKEPDRTIYLAVPVTAYLGIFRSPVGEVAITDFALRLLVFEAEQEVIVQWIE